MSNTSVNITLQSKSEPTINIQTVDGGSVTSNPNFIPTINFVATGPVGAQGAQGTQGADGSGGSQLTDNSIQTSHIINGAVTGAKIANYTISASKLLSSSVSTIKLQNSSVTTEKLADNSVTAAKIADGAITNELIDVFADFAIKKEKIEYLGLDASVIALDAIITSKIKDRNVTGLKIESNPDLDGEVKANNLKLKGSSPATLTGPDSHALQIKSNTTIDFQNTSNTTIASLDQSGNLTISGNVDGRNISTDGSKLDTISNNAQPNVKSNWNETDSNSDAFIQNKPTIPANTDTTYNIQCVDGDNSDEQKIRLTASGSGSGDDDVVLEAGTGLSISRSGDKITFTNTVTDTDTQLPFIDDDTMATASSTNVASAESVKAYVDAEVSGIVDSAPNTLNTLNELADALGDDENFSTTVTNNIATKQPILSEGAFADGDKTKLDGIATGATANTGDATLAGIQTFTGAKTFNNITALHEESDDSGYIKFKESADNGSSSVILKAPNALATDRDVILPSSAGTIALTSDVPADLETDGAGTIHANNVPTLNQDTTGNAATATNLTGGNKSLNGTFTSEGLIVDGNVTFTPGDGAAIHVDAADMTDNVTSASGTALAYNHVTIENPRILATNSSVTTINASTLYIKGAPVASTNQTITNAWAFYIGSGNSYFAGAITANGGVTGDVTGNVSGSSGSCTGNAATATTATTATNLVASTSTAVQLGTIELGDASDTTISRTSPGTVAIEGNTIATTNKLIDTKTAAYWSSSTSGFYITLSGASTSENTSLSTASYTLMYVVPFDGKIKRISSFHQNNASGTSTFEMYIDGDDSDLTNDQRGSDMTTSSYNRKFTEDCPADWTFSKGEAIAIKRTDSVARYGATMTIVFEYDTTT